MSRLLLLALLLLPLSGLAQAVYRTTDAQGNVVFTDSPPANATPADRVEIRPTNTVQPPQIPPRPASENTPNAQAEVAADLVDAVEPAADEPLEIQLVGDAQVQLLTVGVVMSGERPRCRSRSRAPALRGALARPRSRSASRADEGRPTSGRS